MMTRQRAARPAPCVPQRVCGGPSQDSLAWQYATVARAMAAGQGGIWLGEDPAGPQRFLALAQQHLRWADVRLVLPAQPTQGHTLAGVTPVSALLQPLGLIQPTAVTSLADIWHQQLWLYVDVSLLNTSATQQALAQWLWAELGQLAATIHRTNQAQLTPFLCVWPTLPNTLWPDLPTQATHCTAAQLQLVLTVPDLSTLTPADQVVLSSAVPEVVLCADHPPRANPLWQAWRHQRLARGQKVALPLFPAPGQVQVWQGAQVTTQALSPLPAAVATVDIPRFPVPYEATTPGPIVAAAGVRVEARA